MVKYRTIRWTGHVRVKRMGIQYYKCIKNLIGNPQMKTLLLEYRLYIDGKIKFK